MSHASHTALSIRQNQNLLAQQLALLQSFLPLITHLLQELDWQALSVEQKRALHTPLCELASALLLACTITRASAKPLLELAEEIPL